MSASSFSPTTYLKCANMKVNYISAVIIFSTSLLTACATYPGKPKNPPPDEEFTAIGISESKSASYEVALKEAKSICSRWDAVPSVLSREVKIDDDLMGMAKKGIEIMTKGDDISIGDISGIAANSTVETKLVYKCYQ